MNNFTFVFLYARSHKHGKSRNLQHRSHGDIVSFLFLKHLIFDVPFFYPNLTILFAEYHSLQSNEHEAPSRMFLGAVVVILLFNCY
jgi:hypothetical protein